MTLRIRFVISLIAILLLSWADVFFVGTHRSAFIPDLVRQSIHFIALLMTMFIGYLNWKDYPEKWLAGMWITIYGVMIMFLISAIGLYLLKVPYSLTYLRAALYLRNRFIWPLIFLIWYMLHLMSKHLIKSNTQ